MILYISQALLNLLSAKLRSFLAVLGVLIGTAAVVALLSCGRLATEKALAQFKTLGTDLLAITVYASEKASQNQSQLPLSFWRRLPEKINSIMHVAPYAQVYQPISFQGKLLQGSVIGADESLATIMKIKLASGHFVSFVQSFEHFCVVGHGLAQQLQQESFGNPIGKQLQIDRVIYTIVGVAEPWQENGFFNDDINQTVIIPIAGVSLVSKETKINHIIFLLKSDSVVDKVITEIKQAIHQQAPKLNVFSRSAKQLIASMEEQGRIFTWLLAIIGGISLLVGGIGIMNIMLVSVSERKKEIGIRKAVGATDRDIQNLFLIESLMLSLLGGILGIILGLLFTRGVAYFSHWPFRIFLSPLIVGFAVSVATGIFFGFYPAKRAAKLEPIDCLRQA